MEVVLSEAAHVKVEDERLSELPNDDQARYHTFSVVKADFATPGFGSVLIINTEGIHELISIEWLVELMGTGEAAALMGVPSDWLSPPIDSSMMNSTTGGFVDAS